jgi:hypothetical protein
MKGNIVVYFKALYKSFPGATPEVNVPHATLRFEAVQNPRIKQHIGLIIII